VVGRSAKAALAIVHLTNKICSDRKAARKTEVLSQSCLKKSEQNEISQKKIDRSGFRCASADLKIGRGQLAVSPSRPRRSVVVSCCGTVCDLGSTWSSNNF